MEFQEIQDKLNALLTGDKRKVVFWYDDASYAEEVDNLQLGENCKLWKLTEGNHFATKLQILFNIIGALIIIAGILIVVYADHHQE